MTKSTITRERIQRIIRAIDSEAYDEEEIRGWLSSDEIMELSRIALSAMDSESVGTLSVRHMSYSGKKIGNQFGFVHSDAEMTIPEGDYPLYRHAQPVAEVPEDVLDALQKVARIRLDMNDFDGDRRGIADCLCDAEEALIEVVNRRAAMLAAAPQSPGSEPATMPGKWIPVSEQKPDCWCLTCRPVVLNDMRFVVCPDCGNKRCPRANDHRNACTGSNEPGQEGGAYPDTPQEVKP